MADYGYVRLYGSTVTEKRNINYRICSAIPTVISKAHYTVNVTN